MTGHAILALPLMVVMAMAAPCLAGDDFEEVVVSKAQQARLFDAKVRARADQLVRISTNNSDSDELISTMKALVQDHQLEAAQRDAVFYEFIRQLRTAPSWTVDAEALRWLQHYSSRAVYPHPKSRTHLIPLFNVAAAASGLHNQWTYQAAAEEVRNADRDGIKALLERFANQPDGPYALGLRSALNELTERSLALIAETCLDDEMLKERLLPHVNLARGRVDSVANQVETLDAAVASEILFVAQRWLNPVDALTIQQAALRHESHEIQGLAMGQLTTYMKNHLELQEIWSEQLVAWLSDPQLGAAAALQLARLPDDIWRNERLYSVPDPMAARRLELIDGIRTTLPAIHRAEKIPR